MSQKNPKSENPKSDTHGNPTELDTHGNLTDSDTHKFPIPTDLDIHGNPTSLSFEEKHELALAELSRTPMKTRACFPPLHRLARRLGVKLRPPHYAPFKNVVATMALMFGLVFGALMHFTLWSGYVTTLSGTLSKTLLIGVFLGVVQAAYYSYGFKKHNLTEWDKLGSAGTK